MTANPLHPRHVEIAASTEWSAEVGPGFLTLVADMRRAGLGVTRIEIANSAVDGMERALIHPPGWATEPVTSVDPVADLSAPTAFDPTDPAGGDV